MGRSTAVQKPVRGTAPLTTKSSSKAAVLREVEITVYGLCVLREREPAPGAKVFDILLVGEPGLGRAPAHMHDPKIVYNAAYEDPSASGMVERSMVYKKIDLTWLTTKTNASQLNRNLVNLSDEIARRPLAPNPEQIPAVAGYLTVLAGKRIQTENVPLAGWALMDPNTYKLGPAWGTIAWCVNWWIKVEGSLTTLDWSIDSLRGDPNPIDAPALHPDASGRIKLEVWNLPQGVTPPTGPGKPPGSNEYVEHFAMYRHLYPEIDPWPYLVYDPKEGAKPTKMKDAKTIVTTTYTCVPSGGK
jgi:hypothetical protein